MSEPFIAEIRIFAGNFAPRGWAFCDGQLLPIGQNTALFSLLGTTYGGDGRSTVGLPNLQGRAVMGPGRGPGLSARRLGERGGVETVTLSEAQMPQHTHALQGSSSVASANAPGNNMALARSRFGSTYIAPAGGANVNATFNSQVSSPVGGSQAHNNLQPFLAINFIIALIGLYPSRS